MKYSPEQLVIDLFASDPLWAAKGSETSRDAANEIFDFAKGIRGKVAKRLVDIYPEGETPDETADALEISILTARPRFSELRALGLIEKVGERRPTRGLVSGAKRNNFKSEVWRASALLLGSNVAPSIVPGIEGAA
jgi:hypothetical protein